MVLPPAKYIDRLKDRDAALKRRNELLLRRARPAKVPETPVVAVAPVAPVQGDRPAPRTAAVRMQGDSILAMLVPEAAGAQHLSPALRYCVDLYLQAAQCGKREVVLLWPGTLESLPLIHAIATIEYWAQGYKQGLRAVFYPATTATFRRLNHVFVDRDDVLTMNNEVREVAFSGINPAVKQKCEKKDLMLYALAGIKDEAKAAGLQPCLNDLLPHFYLETGERNEITQQSYANDYLSHVLTKLSRSAQAKALRETTLPGLAEATVAPDTVFALSFEMTKAQIEQALRSLKAVGRVNVVLLDATRVAFGRVEKLQNRIAAFARLVSVVFGDDGPGILVVTNDPREMTQLRAALVREAKERSHPVSFGKTHGLCHPGQKNDLGLRSAAVEPPIVLNDAVIAVSITDRESSKLVTAAYRLSTEHGVPLAVIDVLRAASKFVQRMANLPSSAELLHKWLNESMADEAQRKSFDWVAQRNRLKEVLGDLDVGMRGRVFDWIKQTDALLLRQQAGTPLARALIDRIKTRAGEDDKVLVVVQSRFYADLAKEYFLRDPDSERFVGRVHFTAIRMLDERLTANGPSRVIVCALSPDLLRWAITSPTLPGTVDFLLTQQTAQGAYYTLEPVMRDESFKPYFPRVQAIFNPIKGAAGAINAVLPDFDYQAPAWSITALGGALGSGERGPTDYVDIAIEDGRVIHRGRGSRVYVYDPAARESRALGFRVDCAEHVKVGHQIFVMSEEMREQAEATFATAGVTFDEASRYEKLLRHYHAQVLQRVRERFPGSVAESARLIGQAMQKANVAQDVQNIRYWINLQHAAETPFDDLLPQAPRHFETFRAFMEVLGFDATMIQGFWEGGVKRVRGTRISDGLNLGDRYDRVLFDPDAAATYDELTSEVLNALRVGALDNVYEVTEVSFGTTNPRG